ncbi:MAG: IPT/TIG domain-containing protein [Flavisolibacter sp.]
MTKLSFLKLPLLGCTILTLAFLFSCTKKDGDPYAGKVVLNSFGPTGAKHGDTIRFIGANLNKVTAIQFTGTNAVVDQKQFKSQTSSEIKLIVPDAAEKGYVTLRTPDGDLVTKTQFNLDVLTTVTSLTKQARPGDNVTITGTYLNWVDRVTFNNNKTVRNFSNQSMTQLVVKVPDDAQTGTLVLHYTGTDSADLETKDTLNVTLPVITTLSPNPVKHKTNLTITGTNLDLAKQVLFAGVSTPVTSFVSQTATQLVVVVPSGTQKGKVTLAAASGVKTVSTADLDVLLPAITAMAPNPIDPGTNLTITGTNLDLVTNVSFVGVLAPVTSFVSASPTQIVVKVPTGVLKGKITLGVLNSILTVTSAADLQINGGLPPLADFTLPVYTDATQSGFQDWSYTNVHDFNNSSNVRQGTKSILATYKDGDYQGLTFHNPGAAPSMSGYTTLEFSVFGETGTGGKKLNIVINGDYSHVLQQATVKEGEWATFDIPLSSLGSPATISEIVLQATGWGGTLHVDHVGFR